LEAFLELTHGAETNTSSHLSRVRADKEMNYQDQKSDGLIGFGFETGKKQWCSEILYKTHTYILDLINIKRSNANKHSSHSFSELLASCHPGDLLNQDWASFSPGGQALLDLE